MVAPLVYSLDLVEKVVDLLEDNQRLKDHGHTHDAIILTQCRTGWLTWHNGVIPASEVWIKIRGDKGGGSFK